MRGLLCGVCIVLVLTSIYVCICNDQYNQCNVLHSNKFHPVEISTRRTIGTVLGCGFGFCSVECFLCLLF